LCSVLFLSCRLHRHPISLLFPYTTLFRSLAGCSGGTGQQPNAPPPPGSSSQPAGHPPSPPPSARTAAFNIAEVAKFESPWALTLDRKSTRLNSSHVKTSYAVLCSKKKINL